MENVKETLLLEMECNSLKIYDSKIAEAIINLQIVEYAKKSFIESLFVKYNLSKEKSYKFTGNSLIEEEKDINEH